MKCMISVCRGLELVVFKTWKDVSFKTLTSRGEKDVFWWRYKDIMKKTWTNIKIQPDKDVILTSWNDVFKKMTTSFGCWGRNKIIKDMHVIIHICYSCILTWNSSLYRWIFECLSQLPFISVHLLHGTLWISNDNTWNNDFWCVKNVISFRFL